MEPPTRLVEYFAIIGLSSSLKVLRQTSNANFRASEITWQSFPKYAFAAEILDRYPKKDHEDCKFPPNMPLFCFPNDVMMTKDISRPRCFGVLFTDVDGRRYYMMCLVFQELLPRNVSVASTRQRNVRKNSDGDKDVNPPRRTSSAQDSTRKFRTARGCSDCDESLFTPKALCIVSQFGFLDEFRKCLKAMYEIAVAPSAMPLEAFIYQLICEIPPPHPGCRLTFRISQSKISMVLPKKSQFELTRFSLLPLFHSLGISLTVRLIEHALNEHKIILCSSQLSFISIAAETIRILMNPFEWHHIYVPVLPRKLIDFTQAPTPFIIGVHASYKDAVPPHSGTDRRVWVDLDNGTLEVQGAGEDFSLAGLPKAAELRANLKDVLFADLVDMDDAFGEDLPASALVCKGSNNPMDMDGRLEYINYKLQNCFLNVFVELFYDYVQFITVLRTAPKLVTVFNKLKCVMSKETRAEKKFLGMFLDTQAFSVFLQHQSDLVQSSFRSALKKRMRAGQSLNNKMRPISTHLFASNTPLNARDSDPPAVSKPFVELDIPSPTINVSQRTFFFGGIDPSLMPSEPRNFQFPEKPPYDEKLPKLMREKRRDGATLADRKSETNRRAIDSSLRKILNAENVLPGEAMAMMIDLMVNKDCRLYFVGQLYKHTEEFKGRITHLPREIFDQFLKIVKMILEVADDQSDFRSPSLIIAVAESLCRESDGADAPPQPLHTFIRSFSLWKSRDFWEASFFESVDDMRQEQNLDNVKLSSLSPEELKVHIKIEGDLLFGLLGTYTNRMINSGVEIEQINHFLRQMSNLSGLDWDKLHELETLVNNMMRINKVQEEDQTSALMRKKSAKAKKRLTQRIQLQSFATSVTDSAVPTDSADMYGKLFGSVQSSPSSSGLRVAHSLSSKEVSRSVSFSTDIESERERPREDKGEKKERTSGSESERSEDEREKRPLEKLDPPSPLALNLNVVTSAETEREDDVPALAREMECPVKCTTILRDHSKGVGCIIVLGSNLVTAALNGDVKLWTISPENEFTFARDFVGHKQRVNALIAMDNTVVSASADKTVIVWNWDLGTPKERFEIHEQEVTALTSYKSLVISGGMDGVIRVVDIKQKDKEPISLVEHDAAITCFSLREHLLFSGSRDNTVKVWDLRSNTLAETLKGHSDWIKSIRADTKRIISTSYDGSIIFRDAVTHHCLNNVDAHKGCINSLDVRENKLIVTGGADGSTQVRDMDTSSLICSFSDHDDEVQEVMFLNDDEIVTCSYDQTLHVYDFKENKCIAVLKGHTDWVYALAVLESKKGSTIVSGSWDSTVRVWWRAKTEKKRRRGGLIKSKLFRSFANFKDQE